MALARVPPQPALRHNSLAPAQSVLLQATAESAGFGRQFRDTLCDIRSYSLDMCLQDLGHYALLPGKKLTRRSHAVTRANQGAPHLF